MYGRGGRTDPNSPWQQPGIPERLEELCFAQLTNTAIAQQLSSEFNLAITKNAVVARRHRTGLAFGRWRPTREEYETPVPTLETRLQAYHDNLDAILLDAGRKRRTGVLYVRL